MKRKLALLLALIMAFLLIAGCDGGSKPEPSGSEPAGSEDPVDTTEPPDVDTSPTNINLCIASEPETLDPVSYTHLDVYKRQGSRPWMALVIPLATTR